MKLNVDALAKKLTDSPIACINGWVFEYEYPGYFAYSKSGWTVYCTPNFECEDAILVQVLNSEGEAVGEGDQEIPFTEPLTAEKFILLIAPVLLKTDGIIRQGVPS